MRNHVINLLMPLAGLLVGSTALALSQSSAADTLFARWTQNPLFRIDHGRQWRSIHIANAAVLTPDESPDNTWRLYVRGSGRFPEETRNRNRNYHDSIGLFTQKAEDFSPFGPWHEHPSSPLLEHGPPDSSDGKHLLDCCPVWGKDSKGERDILYMFYKGVAYGRGGCLAGAWSEDGGITFRKFDTNPLQRRVGPCDVVFHDNRYYIFYGDAKYDDAKERVTDRLKTYLAVTADPTDISRVPRRLVLDVGPPGSFDQRSVHGGRIFRLDGTWFMVYQASARHFDYPDRFHAAYSMDLLHWTKVDNPQPLFERGESGQWDQGAIWFGEVFQHQETLYMLYEGWGWEGHEFNRRKAYAKPGRSQVGIASVTVKQFRQWCRLPMQDQQPE